MHHIVDSRPRSTFLAAFRSSAVSRLPALQARLERIYSALTFSENTRAKTRLYKNFLFSFLPTSLPSLSYFVANAIVSIWTGRSNENASSAVSAITAYQDLITVSWLGFFSYAVIPMIAFNQRTFSLPLFFQSLSFSFLIGLAVLALSFASRPFLSLGISNPAILDFSDSFFKASIHYVIPWLFFIPSFLADSFAIGTGNLVIYNISRWTSSMGMVLLAYLTLYQEASQNTIFQKFALVIGLRDMLNTLISFASLMRVNAQYFTSLHYFDPPQNPARPWYYFDGFASFKQQLMIGLPINIGIAIELIQFYFANNIIIAAIGSEALSIRYVLMLVFLILRVPFIFGDQNTAMSLVSKALGNHQYDKVIAYGDMAIYAVGLIIGIASVIVLSCHRQIAELALNTHDPSNQPIFEKLTPAMWGTMLVAALLEGLGYAAFGALNGIRKTKLATGVLAVSFLPLSSGLGYLFGVKLGYDLPGYYWGHIIAMACFSSALCGAWYYESRKLQQLHRLSLSTTSPSNLIASQPAPHPFLEAGTTSPSTLALVIYAHQQNGSTTHSPRQGEILTLESSI